MCLIYKDAIFLYWVIFDDNFIVLLLTYDHCLIDYHGFDASVDLEKHTYDKYMDHVKCITYVKVW